MKEFGYKGAGDLATYVDHCFQWDATSDVMEDWMYEKFAEKYALDKDMQDWFNQVNPGHCSVLLQFCWKQSKEIYGTLSRKQKLNCKNYIYLWKVN